MHPDAPKSAMISLLPLDAEALASPEGDPPDELHVTAAFLGEASEIGPGHRRGLAQAMHSRLADQAPIPAAVAGAGVLGDEGAVVLFLQHEDLQTVCDHAYDACDEANIDHPPPHPNFLPHLTIGYGKTPESTARLLEHAMSLVGQVVELDRCGIHFAGEVYERHLDGVREDETEEPEEEAPAEDGFGMTDDEAIDEMAMGEFAPSGGRSDSKKRDWDEGKVKRKGGKFAPKAGGGGGGKAKSAPAAPKPAPGGVAWEGGGTPGPVTLDGNGVNTAVDWGAWAPGGARPDCPPQGFKIPEVSPTGSKVMETFGEGADAVILYEDGSQFDGKGWQPRPEAGRIEEDMVPAASPTGAKLVSFDGAGPGVAVYEDGSVLDGKGWRPEPAAKAPGKTTGGGGGGRKGKPVKDTKPARANHPGAKPGAARKPPKANVRRFNGYGVPITEESDMTNLQLAPEEFGFSPGQPRDKNGKWTRGGSAGASGGGGGGSSGGGGSAGGGSGGGGGSAGASGGSAGGGGDAKSGATHTMAEGDYQKGVAEVGGRRYQVEKGQLGREVDSSGAELPDLEANQSKGASLRRENTPEQQQQVSQKVRYAAGLAVYDQRRGEGLSHDDALKEAVDFEKASEEIFKASGAEAADPSQTSTQGGTQFAPTKEAPMPKNPAAAASRSAQFAEGDAPVASAEEEQTGDATYILQPLVGDSKIDWIKVTGVGNTPMEELVAQLPEIVVTAQEIPQETVDAVQAALEADGWTVEFGPKPTFVKGVADGTAKLVMRTETAAPMAASAAEVGPDGQWEGLLVKEGIRSGDGRTIELGALTWRDLPLPVMLMTSNPVGGQGHDGASLAGRIDWLERREDEIWGGGVFDMDSADGAEAYRLLDQRFLRGVSVDLDDIEVAVEAPTGDEFDGSMPAVTVAKGRLMGATLTVFPAFQECQLVLTQPALAAAITGEGCDCAHETTLVASAGVGLPQAQVRIYTPWDREPAALVASAGVPVRPPAGWFSMAALSGPTPFRITKDGRVYGHVATFGSCHIGFGGKCVNVPRSNSNYRFFANKQVETDEGSMVGTGTIMMDTVHPDLKLRASDAQAFYAHTGSAVADVALYEDEWGIQAAGALRPGVTPEQVRALRGSDISPDWRPINGRLECVALLAVNTSGFITPALVAAGSQAHVPGRVAAMIDMDSGEITALVAAGMVQHRPDDVSSAIAELRAEIAELRSIVRPIRAERARARMSAKISA